jgi:hypothetical protein
MRTEIELTGVKALYLEEIVKGTSRSITLSAPPLGIGTHSNHKIGVNPFFNLFTYSAIVI